MVQCYLFFLVVFGILGEALGFQVLPPGASPTAWRSLTPRSSLEGAAGRRSVGGKQRPLVAMQLGGDGGGPIERGNMPSYEEEQSGEADFFKTDLDKQPDSEKVKDPLVLITLGWIVGMFLVATVFIIGGVN